ncbi:MAG: hypothetical protein ACTSPY_10295 [Candidatus Helarchaeota archaeon]
MMLVIINKKTIEECREQVNKFMKGENFKEVGGYLIGTYDYNMNIELLFLDKLAESTPIRIKLSSESFIEVENLLNKFPNFQYIGTWHVHPGKNIPFKSEIDEATLFLERFVLETDNPEQFKCPRIHLIFNENFTEVKCYSMKANIDVELLEVEAVFKPNVDLNVIEIIRNRLNEIEFTPNNVEDIEIDELDEIYNNLVEIRDLIDSSLDSIESLIMFEESKEIFYNNTDIIEDIILLNIRNNINIGLLAVNDKNVVIDLPYRPANFDPSDLDSDLFGFWKYYPYKRIDPLFENIFLANFYLKLEEQDYSTQFFYFRCNKELRIEPFILKFNSFKGITYEEIKLKIMDDEEHKKSE